MIITTHAGCSPASAVDDALEHPYEHAAYECDIFRGARKPHRRLPMDGGDRCSADHGGLDERFDQLPLNADGSTPEARAPAATISPMILRWTRNRSRLLLRVARGRSRRGCVAFLTALDASLARNDAHLRTTVQPASWTPRPRARGASARRVRGPRGASAPCSDVDARVAAILTHE
jgi:hypothetical protein